MCLIYDLPSEKLVEIKKNSYSEFDFIDPLDTLVLLDCSKYFPFPLRSTKPIHLDS